MAYPECLEQEAVIGFPVEWTQTPAAEAPLERPESRSESAPKGFSCPKCETAYGIDDAECSKCGLIFANFKKEGPDGGSRELRALWQVVLDDYESQQAHDDFMTAGLRAKKLSFVAAKYRPLVETNPNDEIAESRLDQVRELMMTEVKVEKVTAAPAKGVNLFRLDRVIIILSAMIIVIGYFIPGMRNLVGFGVAILFFTLALKFLFGRSS